MKKNLETLIQELCPDGVEFVKLGEVFDLFSGMSKVSNKWAETGNCKFIDYLNIYNNIIVDVNKLQNATVASFKQNVLKKGDILFTCASETPRECAISAVIRDSIADNTYLDDHLNGIRVKSEFIDKVNPVFVNYYFYSPRFRVAICKIVRGVTRFYIVNKNFLKIEIPLPPLEVQTEIVRILDKFTSLEAELEAELDCRKRQYEYYRDKLLSFENAGGQEVEWKKMSEVCLKTSKIKWTDASKDFRYIDLSSVDRANHSILECQVINASNAPSRAQQVVLEDDILFGTTRPTLMRFCHIPKEYNGQICSTGYCVIRVDKRCVNSHYIYHFLFTKHFYDYVESHQKGASYPAISNKDVMDFTIPVPSLAEQGRIASILDRFESLTTSLQSGLPAEISARRQQYEYYRDKLLTFKRKTA